MNVVPPYHNVTVEERNELRELITLYRTLPLTSPTRLSAHGTATILENLVNAIDAADATITTLGRIHGTWRESETAAHEYLEQAVTNFCKVPFARLTLNKFLQLQDALHSHKTMHNPANGGPNP